MRYFLAIVSSIIIFIGVFLLLGIGLAIIMPVSWSQTWINLGLLSTNVPSLVAFVVAGLTAMHTFKVSLRAKSWLFYKGKSESSKHDTKNMNSNS
jgi:hypothetical protein